MSNNIFCRKTSKMMKNVSSTVLAFICAMALIDWASARPVPKPEVSKATGKVRPTRPIYNDDDYLHLPDKPKVTEWEQEKPTVEWRSNESDAPLEAENKVVPTQHVLFEQMGEYAGGVSYIHVFTSLSFYEAQDQAEHYHQQVRVAGKHLFKAIIQRAQQIEEQNKSDHAVILSHFPTKIPDNSTLMEFLHIAQEAAGDRTELHLLCAHLEIAAIEEDHATFLKQQFKNLATSMPSPVARHKRFVEWILLGIWGAVLTFAAIANRVSINKMEKQLEEQTQLQDMILKIDNRLTNSIGNAWEAIDLDTRSIDTLVRFNPGVLASKMSWQRSRIEARYTQLRSAMNAAMNQRLSNGIIPEEHLQLVFQELEEKAEKTGHKLVPYKPAHLYQMDTTIILQEKEGKQELVLMTHVPMTRPEMRMQLFLYHPVPMTMKNGLTMEVRPPHDEQILALAKENDRRYKVLSAMDLNRCEKKHDLYLCPGQGIMQEGLNNTCLGAIHALDEGAVRALCEVHIGPGSEMAYQVDDYHYMTYVPTPLAATARCPNDVVKRLKFQGHSRLTLAPGCRLDLRSHFLSAELSFSMTTKMQHFPWVWDPASALQNYSAAEILAHFDKKGHLKERKEIKEIQALIEKAEAKQEEIKKFGGLHSYTPSLGITSILCISFAVIAVVYILYKYRKNRKHIRVFKKFIKKLLEEEEKGTSGTNNTNAAPPAVQVINVGRGSRIAPRSRGSKRRRTRAASNAIEMEELNDLNGPSRQSTLMTDLGSSDINSVEELEEEDLV